MAPLTSEQGRATAAFLSRESSFDIVTQIQPSRNSPKKITADALPSRRVRLDLYRFLIAAQKICLTVRGKYRQKP
jgi:hypothetical protein